ncbi:RBPJ-interacting and tubulin-associated protein 1-like [Antedon mediterranea]|uniref:RBPJ-interacting and tubulin-associated protein 1-like n=1 Tax=Antedon mediterranea TaxID=105859 RepID=UPI003AF84DE8
MSGFGTTTGLLESGRDSNRPFTGRTTPVKKTYKYRKVAEQSQVDETLFKASAVKLTPKLDINSNGNNQSTLTKKGDETKVPKIKTPLKGMPRTHNPYRIHKHSPSYVDETLFGPRLPTPSFPAPWEKESTVKGQILMWSPPVSGSMSMTTQGSTNRPFSAGSARPSSAGGKRPNSARPSSARPSSAGSTRQPWK